MRLLHPTKPNLKTRAANVKARFKTLGLLKRGAKQLGQQFLAIVSASRRHDGLPGWADVAKDTADALCDAVQACRQLRIFQTG